MKKQRMTFSTFSSLLLVSFLSPRFILDWLLALPVMVIYLVGKRAPLSHPRREFRENEGRKVQRERAHTRKMGTENILSVLVSQVTTTVSLAAVMELKLRAQTVREGGGKKKKNYMSIFVSAGCLDRNRYILFVPPAPPPPPPKASSRALPLFGIKRT